MENGFLINRPYDDSLYALINREDGADQKYNVDVALCWFDSIQLEKLLIHHCSSSTKIFLYRAKPIYLIKEG